MVVITVLGLAARVIVRLERDASLRRDYPPHRHVGGRLLYPKEYEPSSVERLSGAD
jgi:hypothetical protein